MTQKDVLLKEIADTYQTLIKYTRVIAGLSCLDEAEDCLQDVLLKIFAKNNFNEEIKSPPAYIRTCIKNHARQIMAKNKSRLSTVDRYTNDVLKEDILWEDTQIQKHDLKVVLAIAEKVLPEKQLKAMKLALSGENIYVSIEGCSPNTTKANRRHGIDRLRKELVKREEAA